MTQAGPCRIQHLVQSFRLFRNVSKQLSESCRALERRVANLNWELAGARDERQQALTEKKCLANRLKRLFSMLPGGVVVLDGDGTVRDCNSAAIALLGEPLRGERWCDVIARAFAPLPDDGHEISLRDGRRVSLDTCALGEEPGQLLLIHDVTDTRWRQERLARQDRPTTMGEVAANLAHQIRTPLASAMLYASQLAGDGLAEADRQRFAGQTLAGLRHLDKLVNDMLTFVRGGDVENEPVPVSDLLQELQHMLAPLLAAGDAGFQCCNDAPRAVVYGNRSALLGALQNLIVNALQACGPGAQLRLHARPDGEGISVLLNDNGPGIPAELRERIFDPFFTTRAQGTGLGLAVARAVARAHNGDAWLEASSPGHGSTFGLRLPLLDPSEPHYRNVEVYRTVVQQALAL